MPGDAWRHPLIAALFEVGPVGYDGFVTWQELRSWQEVIGIELEPWEACAIVEMSKAFFTQQRLSTSPACLCPWPKGQAMWQYVSGKLQEKHKEAEEALKKSREKEPDGNRKRHRNSPPG